MAKSKNATEVSPRDEIVTHLGALRAFALNLSRNGATADDLVQDRKARREVQDSEGHFAATLAVKPDHDGRMAMSDFMRAFNELPDEQREALTLVGASGFAYHEAAEMCGVAVGTMKSRVNRGRQRLIEVLELSDDDSIELTDKGTMTALTTSIQVMRG